MADQLTAAEATDLLDRVQSFFADLTKEYQKTIIDDAVEAFELSEEGQAAAAKLAVIDDVQTEFNKLIDENIFKDVEFATTDGGVVDSGDYS